MTPAPQPRKNILMIIPDQWRYDQLGMDPALTPNFHALMRDGVAFENHYGQMVPCAPSRASMYTGLYGMTHRVVVNRSPLAEHQRTFAQHLRTVGYAPTVFGYSDTAADPTHRHPNDPALLDSDGFGLLKGLDVGCMMVGRHWAWLGELRRRGYVFDHNDDLFAADYTKPSPNGGISGHPARYKAEDSDTAFLTDQTIAWLGAQDQGWCAMLCYLRPHPPFIAPEPYNGLVDPATLTPMNRLPERLDEVNHPFMAFQLEVGRANEVHPDLKGRARDVSNTDWQSVRATYCGLMAEVDHNIGRLIAWLKASGQYDNTLIIFTSDHGDPIGDHWLANQASWHDYQAHMPLVIRDPAPEARAFDGMKVSAFTEGVDLVPTLLDYLGIDQPTELDGQSVMPFVRGETPERWRDFVHWEYHFKSPPENPFSGPMGISEDECMLSVIRDERYKHVFFPSLPSLLFDMVNDPGERRNLGSDPAFSAVEREYLAKQLTLRILHADRRTSTTVLGRDGMVRYQGYRRS